MVEPKLSHANFNGELRYKKAFKIASIVTKYSDLSFRRFLEVGAGSGVIAQYFSKAGYGLLGSHAVDVIDERQVTDGFNFQRVQGTSLPFSNESFDFIISNHVIEHVGSDKDQAHHLSEIFRCLEPGGTFYFAVPNRWRLVEPHYGLPLLSWLPEEIASIYVRLFKLGSHYDCKPLTRGEIVELLNCSGFHCVDVTFDAIPLVIEIEGGWLNRCASGLPKKFWKLFSFFIPTLIFVCKKPITSLRHRGD
jgi:SAM-dependent methyltransferase